MIPAYFTSIVYLLNSFIYKENRLSNKWVSIPGWSLVCILQLLAIFLPYALPVIQFPEPPGKYTVGIQTLHIQDTDRPEKMTDDSLDTREFMARLYYPAREGTGKQAKYIPEFPLVKDAFKKKLGWPIPLIEYIELIELHAYNNAEILEEQPFPLIIYSHGLGNNYTEASARLTNIASKGYYVVAINHTYGSDFTVFPDGTILSFKSLSRLGDTLDFVDSTRTIRVEQWVNDFKTAISYLKDSRFNDHIDFNHLGMIGFSNGGSAVTMASTTIPNIKAVVNLDGTPRGTLPDTSGIAYLMMVSERQHYTDEQLAAWGITREFVTAPIDLKENRMQQILLQCGGTWVRVLDTNHSNFIEYPLVSPLSAQLDIGGEVNSWKAYELINDFVYKFMDNKLKNKNDALSNIYESPIPIEVIQFN
jgi:dienelactone hydrolase